MCFFRIAESYEDAVKILSRRRNVAPGLYNIRRLNESPQPSPQRVLPSVSNANRRVSNQNVDDGTATQTVDLAASSTLNSSDPNGSSNPHTVEEVEVPVDELFDESEVLPIQLDFADDPLVYTDTSADSIVVDTTGDSPRGRIENSNQATSQAADELDSSMILNDTKPSTQLADTTVNSNDDNMATQVDNSNDEAENFDNQSIPNESISNESISNEIASEIEAPLVDSSGDSPRGHIENSNQATSPAADEVNSTTILNVTQLVDSSVNSNGDNMATQAENSIDEAIDTENFDNLSITNEIVSEIGAPLVDSSGGSVDKGKLISNFQYSIVYWVERSQNE